MIVLGRKVQHNNIVTDELLAQCNKKNIELGNDFLDYLRSVDRSPNTINAYANDLKIFWVYLLQHCDNKFFIDLSKRDISKYQSYCLTEYKWSPARMRRVKSTLSSLSNYVENMLDDEFENFRPIIRKIENPVNEKVFTKTVLEDEQLEELLNILVDKKKYDKACMLSLAMNSGRRKSELPRFKVSYFDDENIIYGSLYKTPEQVRTKGRGSRGKMLTLYVLSKPFKPYLDLWINYRKENGIESEWLFPKKVNGEYIDEPIEAKTLDSWADTFGNILGVDFYFHSLRHFFTTACSRSGLPDDVIQMLIGWSSLDMVSVYKDIDADEQFEKYFADGGIKKVEQKSLSEL
uniref:Integrase n=1 Tax=Siphoviridae sp. ctXZx16 TaxID=2826371 RepID=A0A8S5MKT4_9CAUD|nr:MAG TPA: SITE SPECIFIC RECOMBINASE XERD [Siphoviridae sp. ctXZx16]DAE83822.1 MAG TPA: SITE SPECIFIC RECOMBINASE XERD [Bacteriophage sp.]